MFLRYLRNSVDKSKFHDESCLNFKFENLYDFETELLSLGWCDVKSWEKFNPNRASGVGGIKEFWFSVNIGSFLWLNFEVLQLLFMSLFK